MRTAEPHPLWRHLPLLAGELVLGSAALAAITLTIKEPLYEVFVHLALVAGLVVSALGVGRRTVFALPGAVMMLVAVALYLARNFVMALVGLFFPPEVTAHEDIVLAALIAWFLVAFSFWQASRANLIFMIVSGLAIFGLMGTVNLNAELLMAFATFMCAAVFCWGYEQFLVLDERLEHSGQGRSGQWLEMARGQLSVALLVGLLTFTAGSVVGSGAYHVSPNLYAAMSKRAYGWDINRPGRALFNSFDTILRIGSGPVRLDPIPVMEVRADHEAFWRGMVYDFYDGHQWSRSVVRGQTEIIPGGRLEYALPEAAQPARGVCRLNRQHVVLQQGSNLAFAAAEPVAVGIDAVSSQPGTPFGRRFLPQPIVDAYGCLSWRGGFGSPVQQYSVDSLEVSGDPALLRAASPDYSAPDLEPYLQVPPLTVAALQPLAQSLTAAAPTPYDKTVALKAYVEKRCLYSMSAPAIPHREEAVNWFLNRGRQGACDMFASSLAVLCRLAGVPARVATGYVAGEYNEKTATYTVRGNDAHAWTEVYFNGLGWVTFNPDPAARYDRQSLTSLLASGYWEVGLRRLAHRVLVIVVVAVLLLTAAAAVVDPLQFLRRFLTRGPQGHLARLSAEYRDFYALLLKRSRLEFDEALTPREAVAAIARSLPGSIRLDRRRLQALNERFYHVRYDRDVSYADVSKCRDELAALRRQLSRRR